MRYFEVSFGQYKRSPESYLETICIKGRRKPSRVEAMVFCEADMDMMGGDFVKEVKEITHTQAKDEFDLSNEDDWPVFAEDEYEDWGEEGIRA